MPYNDGDGISNGTMRMKKMFNYYYFKIKRGGRSYFFIIVDILTLLYINVHQWDLWE